MFDRVICKRRAKQTLHNNIVGNIVLQILNLVLPVIIYAFLFGSINYSLLLLMDIDYIIQYTGLSVIFKLFWIEMLLALVFTPLMLYIINLYQIRQARHQGEKVELIKTLKEDFTFDGFIHFFLVLLVSNVFLVLWTFVFIIPTFIKMYSYSQVCFLAIEEPDLGILDTITTSRIMNKGAKFDLFVTDVSFIGWVLLSVITLGISNLYVVPYICLTETYIYICLKDRVIFEEPNDDLVDVDIIYEDQKDEY